MAQVATTPTKTRVLLLAGGRSGEHEVSLTSARSLLTALQGSNIEIDALIIDRTGGWLTPADSQRVLAGDAVRVQGEPALRRAAVVEEYDVVFPLLHGPFGEDGTVQGMLEMAGVPYVGCGVLASSVCMDKPMLKDVLAAHGIAQVRYQLVTRHGFEQDAAAAIASCEGLGPPWFVKPANLGSSVGIHRVAEAGALHGALVDAFGYDRRVIVEQGLDGAREIEVAILGNEEPEASPVGEITYDSAFYDYATKYTDGKARLSIPAEIPEQVAEQVQQMGCRAFRLLDCAGLARVDFFYRPQSGQVLLSELNTIPGFTPLSMFPLLWQSAGLSYPDLVTKLVGLALQRHR